MTVYTWARPRRFPGLPSPTPRYFDVADDARVLAHCFWQPRRQRASGHSGTARPGGLLVGALHARARRQGVGARVERGAAQPAQLRRHRAPVRRALSLRADGRSRGSSSTSSLAVDRVQRIGVVGYSLGGNLTMKLAGEFGAGAPAALRGVCAVSPTMELATCVDALERRENRLYAVELREGPQGTDAAQGRRVAGSVRPAPASPDSHGATVRRGVHRAAPRLRRRGRLLPPRRVDASRRPRSAFRHCSSLPRTTPSCPPSSSTSAALARNPAVTRVITRYGGHCGFVADARNGSDGYWAEEMAIGFLARQFGETA